MPGFVTRNADEFDDVVSPIIKLKDRDIRNRVIRRVPLQYLLVVPYLKRDERYSTSGLLEKEYASTLFSNKRLRDLPTPPNAPHISILATSLTTGQIVAFTTGGVYFYPVKIGKTPHSSERGILLAKAVAASSAFPPLFSPILLHPANIGMTLHDCDEHRLTDGGVFDNLGVHWLAFGSPLNATPLDLLIISNAGRPFDVRPAYDNRFGGLVRRNVRANDILMERMSEYDAKSVVRQNFPTIEIKLGKRYPSDFQDAALSPSDQLKVETTRTDLDRFDDALVKMIIEHGRTLTRYELNRNGI